MKQQAVATYKPLPWQIAPWRCRSPVMLLTGSAGGGKSRLAAEKVHAYSKKYSQSSGLILRKVRQSMTNSTLIFFERTVVGNDSGVRHFSSKNRFEYANRSIVAYGGMANEEQKEQIRSIGQAGGLGIAWMEEANRFSEDDYNELIARMRGDSAPWRQIILSTNPGTPTHWIKRRLIDGGEAQVFYSRATDNSYNPADYLLSLNRLTGVKKLRLRDGLWVQAEGVVYEDADDAIHVIDPFPIPHGWRRIRAIDFGYTNPFVCQWWAIDHDERMYLYREIYKTRRVVRQHAEKINEFQEPIEASICDHDAEDRATLHENGIPTITADKRISVGIERVSDRLKLAGDGLPRLFVFKNALVEMDGALDLMSKPTFTWQEISGYSWPLGADGKAMKETPVDLDNHGMDAMRYAVMYLDGKQRQADNELDHLFSWT